MKLKAGYNDEPLELRISGSTNGSIQLWVNQSGLPEEASRYRETLSYMTLDEALALKQELEAAVKSVFGIGPEY